MRPLILVDGSSLKNVQFNMGARVKWHEYRRLPFGVAQLTSSCSRSTGCESEYYHPFTPTTHWFVAPRVLADSDPFYFYDNNQLRLDLSQEHGGGGLDFGYLFGNVGELRFGYEGGWEGFQRQVGNPQELPSLSGGLCRCQGPVSVGSLGRSPSFLVRVSPAMPISSGRTAVRWRGSLSRRWKSARGTSSSSTSRPRCS